jgi:hypothetical protein
MNAGSESFAYMSSIPFGYILLSVESISKAFRVQT